MFTVIRNARARCHMCEIYLSNVQLLQVAAYRNMVLPKPKHLELPVDKKKRRLPIMEKTPQYDAVGVGLQVGAFKIRKLPKDLELIRGPELVHNKLQYGHLGIQTKAGGYLRYSHLNTIRMVINRALDDTRMFAIWRVEQPWRPVTKKPLGVRMGSGKGSISDFTYPVKTHRIILEIGGDVVIAEMRRVLKQVSGQMPMKCRVVTKEMLEKESEREKVLALKNRNPFTFEECAKKNFLGIKKEMSPYDMIWFGKYM